MKTLFYTGARVLKIQTLSILLCLVSLSSKAQTYYSGFANPTSTHYNVSSPSGFGCLAPSIGNPVNIANNNLGNYASISGLLSVTLLCSNDVYSIRSKINFSPSSLTAAPANSYAGFLVQLNSVLSLSLLQDNMKLITYKAGVPQDTSENSTILGLSLLSSGTSTNIAFQTDKEFDEVQLLFNTSILPVGLLIDYRFFFAFASTNPIILPVTLTSFTGSVNGKANQLNWQTSSEQNVMKYEVEKQNKQGVFAVIGSVSAKGNSNGAAYSFTDNAVVSTENVYRLKMTDRDNAIQYSKIISVTNVVASKWKVYPTILGSGANVNVAFAMGSSNSKTQIQLANLQGQTLRSISATDSKVVIPTSGLTAGIYIVKLYNNGQLQSQEKIVVQ